MQENKDEDAVNDLEDILKSQPSHRDALYLIAQARLSLGQIDLANAFIADLERFHPTYLKVGLLKIQSAFTAGDTKAALKLANELIYKTQRRPERRNRARRTSATCGCGRLSSRGLAYLELGKLDRGEERSRRDASRQPKSSGAMVNLAKVSTAEQNTPVHMTFMKRCAPPTPRISMR